MVKKASLKIALSLLKLTLLEDMEDTRKYLARELRRQCNRIHLLSLSFFFFDEYEGIEVAWNQVKLRNFTRNPEELEKFFREIHLLKTLNHQNIMRFYTSWVDTDNLSINFVTELFTSGTLRQYRLRHRRVNIKAVKQWCN